MSYFPKGTVTSYFPKENLRTSAVMSSCSTESQYKSTVMLNFPKDNVYIQVL